MSTLSSVAETFEWDAYEYLGLAEATRSLKPDYGTVVADAAWNNRVAAFFFGIGLEALEGYNPPVPAETPEWVSIYMEMIHRDTFSAVGKDGEIDLLELRFPTEVILLEAAYPGGPPILDYRCFLDVTGGHYSAGYYIIANGRVEYYVYETGSEYGYQLSMDGSRAIMRYWVWSHAIWYSIDEAGLHKMFVSDSLSGATSSPPYYTYCDGNLFNPETDTYDGNWRADQELIALTSRGYSGNLSRPEEAIYTLPQHSTWAELEAAFIDILCTHAQNIGQWG